MENFRLFIRLSRPLFLLGAALIYALGAGIARYLGVQIDWTTYWIGQIWVSLMQLSVQYLNEYFNAPMDQNNPNRTFLTGGSGALGPGKLPRQTALFAALITLAFLASITVIVIANIQPDLVAYLIMGLAFLGGIFYSTPPIELESSGYGELTTTFLVAFLVPAYAFILQAGELHRLVAMSAFPLAAFHLAMLIALELPDYATDLKYGKRTLIVRMGWENAMTMHNILIVTAYLLLFLAFSFRFPWFATWPALLTIPLGFMQIYQIRQIARGVKPNWNALTIGAVSLFAFMTYLMAFAFWIN
jgi:1,4-dihydroxy-2-naphthoate octaprenyltransferase